METVKYVDLLDCLGGKRTYHYASGTLPTTLETLYHRLPTPLPRRPTRVRFKSTCQLVSLTHLVDVAKDSDASLGTRASAAKDAVGDKASEQSDKVYYFHHDWLYPLLNYSFLGFGKCQQGGC